MDKVGRFWYHFKTSRDSGEESKEEMDKKVKKLSSMVKSLALNKRGREIAREAAKAGRTSKKHKLDGIHSNEEAIREQANALGATLQATGANATNGFLDDTQTKANNPNLPNGVCGWVCIILPLSSTDLKGTAEADPKRNTGSCNNNPWGR